MQPDKANTDTNTVNHLIDHLFRHESGKMIAVLTKIFGTGNIALAEDVVQDALIEGIKNWNYKGIPDNPSAWLIRVAKNKALNIINRDKYRLKYNSEVSHYLESQWTAEPALQFLFSEEEIHDDQLRMIFTCCHPSVSTDSQVALTLKTLCGFSIPEIAKAFLTTEENINKRLVRARQKIRDARIPFEVPGSDESEKRLHAVLEVIYLLFNEGYNASKGDHLIRYELCEEAMRLASLIIEHPAIHTKSDSIALLAFMQLNASRFRARMDGDGNILTLEQQSRSLWDYSLMEKGFSNLKRSMMDEGISVYHLLAGISGYHCSAPEYNLTDWKSILDLYDKLIALDPSPILLLNRTVALSKVKGPEAALEALHQLDHSDALKTYYLFYSTEAELLIGLDRHQSAIAALQNAIHLAPLQKEKELLEKRLLYCLEKIH